ncbi:hypothetical protein [Hasllibacter sp. MH4015]|uniref:hypothetical protein n=1 Tax=Hasllibacter sp. MH4015 TaxID=2854029 RepID=UPI001CD2C155|nr:hypothetical protein [Hasllibacter sp. MH4015]
MRIAKPLLVLPTLSLLAACASMPAQPTQVEVSRTAIEVTMSNRQTCIGPAPAPATGSSWQGTLQGCDSPYPYRVQLDDSGNPIRLGLEQVFASIGVDIAPIARVEIDGPAGNTWTFASPRPVEDDD